MRETSLGGRKRKKKKEDEQIKKTGPARCSGPEITAPAVWVLHSSTTGTARRRTKMRRSEFFSR